MKYPYTKEIDGTTILMRIPLSAMETVYRTMDPEAPTMQELLEAFQFSWKRVEEGTSVEYSKEALIEWLEDDPLHFTEFECALSEWITQFFLVRGKSQIALNERMEVLMPKSSEPEEKVSPEPQPKD